MNIIFAILIALLSLSDQAVHMGCDAPIPQATECWIVNPDTGTITLLTPHGITYPETAQ